MATGETETSPSGGDRRARRMPLRGQMLIVLTLVTLAVVATAPAASATRAWCRTDPVVVIDGTLADVFVSGPLEAPLLVTGPTKVVVLVPRGVETQLILTDLGFGRGYDVEFKESRKLKKTKAGIEVVVQVYVPATDESMPVKVEFAPRLLGILWPDSAEGTANKWITLKTIL